MIPTARRSGALLAAVALLAAGSAHAADGPIVDRGFTIDAFRGAALGDYRLTGMGGVSLATAEGARGLITNPAAAASRPATASGWFFWDFVLDGYTPGLGADYDNNGVAQDGSLGAVSAGNLGLLFMFGAWGGAVSLTGEGRDLTLSDGSSATLNTALLRLTLARSFSDGEWIAGASLLVGGFDLRLRSAPENLVAAANVSFEIGGLWQPREKDLRLGFSARLPTKVRVEGASCDPNDCRGYVLPERVEFPWTAGTGFAWRFGPTPWNRKVKGDFRDERSTIVAADLFVGGPVPGGAGLEAFLEKRLQRSGRSASLSLHLGAEHEWVPGWFRIRGGTYWEPGRFDGVSGRVHVTLGFDVRFWSFSLWGSAYRLRLSLAADGARQYGNTAFSIGFWG